MFVKLYEYKIKPDKIQEFLVIQDSVSKIYKKSIKYRAIFLRNLENPSKIIEIHWYTNKEEYKNFIELINKRMEIKELWRKFKTIIDPKENDINEQYYEEIRIEDNLK